MHIIRQFFQFIQLLFPMFPIRPYTTLFTQYFHTALIHSFHISSFQPSPYLFKFKYFYSSFSHFTRIRILSFATRIYSISFIRISLISFVSKYFSPYPNPFIRRTRTLAVVKSIHANGYVFTDKYLIISTGNYRFESEHNQVKL